MGVMGWGLVVAEISSAAVVASAVTGVTPEFNVFVVEIDSIAV